jgi:hypothetical protein
MKVSIKSLHKQVMITLKKVDSEKELDAQLNYFRSHADKMQYADYVAAGLPIGSGVTEAGCNELINGIRAKKPVPPVTRTRLCGNLLAIIF